MRCKNCGAENDESRYICEICGSPLYDEDELNDTQNINSNDITTPPVIKNSSPNNNRNDNNNDSVDDKTKKSIIFIIVLTIVLIAIIVGVIVAVGNSSDSKTTTKPTESTSELTTDETTSERTTEKTTEKTTKETTTKKTTTTTTAQTTKETITVSVDFSGEGSVSGDGQYSKGDNVTLVATPADGYSFEGWYENGQIAEVSTRYDFKAQGNVNITAVFAVVGTN